MSEDLRKLTIRGAHEAMKAGQISAKELTSSYLENAKTHNKDLNLYLEIFEDALDMADDAGKKFKDGSATLLTGIPLGIKDNILIKGKRSTAGSKILSGFVSPYDSTVSKKLIEEGAVFLGRTNMDEFAMGSSTENSAYGPSKNPHDITKVPGGSSGGSAGAVAASCALATLGSDTGGSVRQPASFCGCVGLKPTYGAVSRYGLIALGSSLDQIGPLTKTVDDSKIIFDAIKGKDTMDSTSQDKKGSAVMPKKIGVPREILNGGGIHPDVVKNFEESLLQFKNQGFEVVDIKIPSISHSLAVYYIIMPAEASSNLARFDGVKYGFLKEGENLLADYLETRGEGFGMEPRRRIMLGTYVLSSGYYDAYYTKALQARNGISRDFEEAFRDVDVIVTPTTPTPAFKIGEKISDPLSMYLADVFTVPANIVGLPAISVPSGFSHDEATSKDLPLGLQIIAPHFEEERLFYAGKKFLGEM